MLGGCLSQGNHDLGCRYTFSLDVHGRLDVMEAGSHDLRRRCRAEASRGEGFQVRLTNVALAHLEFALKHPALLALMFEAKRQPKMPPELLTALQAAFSHIPRNLQGGQEAGKIVAGDTHRLALTIGAVVQGLVAISIDGKIKGDSLKVLVPEVIGHVLNRLNTNKN